MDRARGHCDLACTYCLIPTPELSAQLSPVVSCIFQSIIYCRAICGRSLPLSSPVFIITMASSTHYPRYSFVTCPSIERPARMHTSPPSPEQHLQTRGTFSRLDQPPLAIFTSSVYIHIPQQLSAPAPSLITTTTPPAKPPLSETARPTNSGGVCDGGWGEVSRVRGPCGHFRSQPGSRVALPIPARGRECPIPIQCEIESGTFDHHTRSGVDPFSVGYH